MELVRGVTNPKRLSNRNRKIVYKMHGENLEYFLRFAVKIPLEGHDCRKKIGENDKFTL